jgi:hypothetical protein
VTVSRVAGPGAFAMNPQRQNSPIAGAILGLASTGMAHWFECVCTGVYSRGNDDHSKHLDGSALKFKSRKH